MDSTEMASKVRLDELAKYEALADRRGFYKIPGRLSESDMNSLLNSKRHKKSYDNLLKDNQFSEADLSLISKYVKAPIFTRIEDEAEDLYSCK